MNFNEEICLYLPICLFKGCRTKINTEIHRTDPIGHYIDWFDIIIDWFMFNYFNICSF